MVIEPAATPDVKLDSGSSQLAGLFQTPQRKRHSREGRVSKRPRWWDLARKQRCILSSDTGLLQATSDISTFEDWGIGSPALLDCQFNGADSSAISALPSAQRQNQSRLEYIPRTQCAKAEFLVVLRSTLFSFSKLSCAFFQRNPSTNATNCEERFQGFQRTTNMYKDENPLQKIRVRWATTMLSALAVLTATPAFLSAQLQVPIVNDSEIRDRGDITSLPLPLKNRLIDLARRPHTYVPATAFSEADNPSRLVSYYLLDTEGFQPNVFTSKYRALTIRR